MSVDLGQSQGLSWGDIDLDDHLDKLNISDYRATGPQVRRQVKFEDEKINNSAA
jgi:hypothetical protein